MNSRENMGALGTRIANMGQTLMQTAIRTGVAAGVSAAAAHIEEEHQKEAKERTDRRLHNTRLLLKNYRLLKRHTAGAIYNAKQAKEKESAASILDGLESYTRDDSLYIESIKRSQERTLIILAHIEKMLDLYRVLVPAERHRGGREALRGGHGNLHPGAQKKCTGNRGHFWHRAAHRIQGHQCSDSAAYRLVFRH